MNQVSGLYEEIMIIKSHQLNLDEKMEDYHAEMMAALDDMKDTLEEMYEEMKILKGKKK